MKSADSETTGTDMFHGARPFFWTMCDEDGDQKWWQWEVDPLTREVTIPDSDKKEIEAELEDADELVFQNSKFDFRAGRVAGIKMPPWSKIHDTLFSGHLLASNKPHDLTSMSVQYLGINIEPLEKALEVAVKEARNLARKHLPDWRIAQKGLPEMPSAKEKVWKYDSWLPRAICLYAVEQRKEFTPTSKVDRPWWWGYREPDHYWLSVLADYANADSAVTLPLFKAHKAELERRGLWEIYLERLKVLPVVYEMEDRGVTLSGTRLKELKARYGVEKEREEKVCLAIAGNGLVKLPKSGSSNALKHTLFEQLKLPVVSRSPKTQEPSVDKYVIEHWLDVLPHRSVQHRFIRGLKDFRKRGTAITYMDSYERFQLPLREIKVVEDAECRMCGFPCMTGHCNGCGYDDPLVDWFVLHPSFNTTGTDTLRWSSSNPNAQNISKDEEFTLRYLFGPAPGREWYSLDYENIELRIPAYESNERVMIDIFEKPNDPPYFGSYHLLNASIVYPDLFWPLAEKKGAFKEKYKATWYQWIKNFGFAIGYGAIERSGTADRAAHKPGAQRMVMDKLKEHSRLNEYWKAYANRFGYVETLPDKTVNPDKGYPILCSRSKWGGVSPTIPLNYHVQSTAMWCMGKAMVRCAEYLAKHPGYRMALQVHDEIVFDFPKRDNRKIVGDLKRLMEQSGDDIGIPLKVSISHHPDNWSESV